ncbi:hypothetical protein B842_01395 [Corynebacterium humireducens NBRC 106098 = DSM 45392]|uniref:Uncharacterized protein n=1 Tax=Corynebacterium humireducens NBRC 106098 = DSM 45392 TaxID=1223515 RepID=A0A0B5CZZ7_9CORY|nr:hypothetical protein [Corynebacterium humireducens]AJE32135.1 hypothetical protein B842_01395 [Corynebacterium humireducens NBRC 106098 = DSM 45392]
MSDKQLTVAELLARSGRDTGDSKTPRPRRRRSLEEGGISVAELTGSIPAVKAKPAESRHSSVPIDAPEGETTTPAAQVSDKQDKQELSPVDRTAAKVAEKQAEKAEKTEAPAKAEAPAKTATPTPGTDETVVFQKVPGEAAETPAPETGEMPAVKTAVATSTTSTVSAVATAEDVEKQEESDALEVTEDAEDGEDEVEEKTSVTGVILMALIGIVLGVVVFKGFELLWESFSRPVVAVLAVLATVGIVGVVKALRTANDGLSMFLAGLVGLVMTFGPLAVVLI